MSVRNILYTASVQF